MLVVAPLSFSPGDRFEVLALWPVEIHTAFGLPAHPLIIHVPLVFIPILGLAAIALAIWPRLQDKWGLPVAVFSVITLAVTLLAVGAGEAFREDRERTLPEAFANNQTLHDHADAGITVRLTMVLLTLVLVAMLFAKRWPPEGASQRQNRFPTLARDRHHRRHHE